MVYLCVYVCTYVFMCVFICVFMCVCIYVCVYVCVCVCIYIHTYIHTMHTIKHVDMRWPRVNRRCCLKKSFPLCEVGIPVHVCNVCMCNVCLFVRACMRACVYAYVGLCRFMQKQGFLRSSSFHRTCTWRARGKWKVFSKWLDPIRHLNLGSALSCCLLYMGKINPGLEKVCMLQLWHTCMHTYIDTYKAYRAHFCLP